MDEKKTTSDNAQVDLLDKEPVVAAVESTPEPTAAAAVKSTKSKSLKFTVIAVVLVLIALLAVLFRLEKEGRVSTNLFEGIISAQEANTPVAVVNGEKLTNEDLQSGVEQLSLSASAQGANVADPAVQAEIQTQALDLLINAELLRQAAIADGVEISDEQLATRISELEESAGGAEALQARLAEFEIDPAQLESDVREELSIQALLDTVFAEATIEATDEDIAEVYDNAVAQSGGQELPPLEEVRVQIEQQIIQTREAEQVELYLQSLRDDADIDLNQ